MRGRSSLELGQLQIVARRVDHGFKELRDDLLRVGEARPVELHEARVAADVGDQQESGLDGHG